MTNGGNPFIAPGFKISIADLCGRGSVAFHGTVFDEIFFPPHFRQETGTKIAEKNKTEREKAQTTFEIKRIKQIATHEYKYSHNKQRK